jgi:hypothetical protein
LPYRYLGECKFYNSKGKIMTVEDEELENGQIKKSNDRRLFEIDVKDGINIQFIKDEELIKEEELKRLGAEKVAHQALNNVSVGGLCDSNMKTVEPSMDPMKYAIIQCWYTKKSDDGKEETTIKKDFRDLRHLTTVKHMKEEFYDSMGLEKKKNGEKDLKKIRQVKYLKSPASAGWCYMQDEENGKDVTLFDTKLTDGTVIMMKI